MCAFPVLHLFIRSFVSLFYEHLEICFLNLIHYQEETYFFYCICRKKRRFAILKWNEILHDFNNKLKKERKHYRLCLCCDEFRSQAECDAKIQ